MWHWFFNLKSIEKCIKWSIFSLRKCQIRWTVLNRFVQHTAYILDSYAAHSTAYAHQLIWKICLDFYIIIKSSFHCFGILNGKHLFSAFFHFIRSAHRILADCYFFLVRFHQNIFSHVCYDLMCMYIEIEMVY